MAGGGGRVAGQQVGDSVGWGTVGQCVGWCVCGVTPSQVRQYGAMGQVEAGHRQGAYAR